MTTTKTAASYLPEVRERAVRLVLEGEGDHPTQWVMINLVATKIGYTTGTLWKLVRQVEHDEGSGPGRRQQREVIHCRGPWRSLEAVEFATLEWADWFSNSRLLEPIGNTPPAAEARYYAQMDTPARAA